MLTRTDNRPVIDRLDERWRSDLILASQASTASERADLARRAARDEITRIRPGVYSLAADPVDASAAHLGRVQALAAAHPVIVASHAAAASLWRLPRLDRWPGPVEIAEPAPYSRRNTTGVIRRRTSLPFSPVIIGGIAATDLDRTTLDLARSDSIASAVASTDAALAGIRFTDGPDVVADRDALLAVLDSIPGQRGVERARWVLGFADGRAERAGESLSRLQIHRLGLTPPVLGHWFEDEEGMMWPDFWWPEFLVAGEMDGRGKYLGPDPEFTRQAILREKHREDRMRRFCRGFARWDWRTANDRSRLGRILRTAGVR